MSTDPLALAGNEGKFPAMMGLLIPAYSPNIANSLTGKDCRLYAVSYLPWRFGAKVRGGPSGRRCFIWRMKNRHVALSPLKILPYLKLRRLCRGNAHTYLH